MTSTHQAEEEEPRLNKYGEVFHHRTKDEQKQKALEYKLLYLGNKSRRPMSIRQIAEHDKSSYGRVHKYLTQIARVKLRDRGARGRVKDTAKKK